MVRRISISSCDRLSPMSLDSFTHLIQTYHYGFGNNFIPTIHIQDLCNCVEELLNELPDKKYFIAVDDSRQT